MSAAGPPQGTRPLGGAARSAVRGEHTSAAIDGATVTLRGRSTLTTGAAKTLHDAIDDWLTKEDALDAKNAGLVDEATETAYRNLDAAVRHLDVVTAALDGVRTQLLGLPVTDGTRFVRYGGDCYCYTQLAMGFADIVIETGLQPYDVQALIPLIEAAGGRITNWQGGPCDAGGDVLACGDPALHATLLRRIAAP